MRKYITILCINTFFIFLSSEVYAFSGKDSIEKNGFLKRVQLSFDIGASVPMGQYGSTSYHLDPISSDAYYAGFASVGFMGDITTNLRVGRTFHFTLTGGFIHQSMSALGLINQNQANIMGGWDNTLAISGTSAYNHFSFLLGPSWVFPLDNGAIGFRFLVGNLFFNIPAIKGTGTFTNYPFINGVYTPSSYQANLSVKSDYQQLIEGDIGLTLQKEISEHISIIINIDVLFSGSGNNGPGAPYTINDMSGNNIYSGTIRDPTNITMFNLTAGMGYNF